MPKISPINFENHGSTDGLWQLRFLRSSCGRLESFADHSLWNLGLGNLQDAVGTEHCERVDKSAAAVSSDKPQDGLRKT